MGSRPLWDIDDVCVWGRGSLMTTEIAAVFYPWALLAESCQLLSLPWAPLGPDEEPKYLQQIILSWHWNEDIIIQHTWECTKSGLCMPNQNVNNDPNSCRLQTKAELESDACTAVTIQLHMWTLSKSNQHKGSIIELLTVKKWTDCHCRGSCWFSSHFLFLMEVSSGNLICLCLIDWLFVKANQGIRGETGWAPWACRCIIYDFTHVTSFLLIFSSTSSLVLFATFYQTYFWLNKY